MVNLFNLTAAAAAASVAILDHTQTFAVDLTNTACTNFTPVEQFRWHSTPAEAWKLTAVGSNFEVNNVRCGTVLSYAGSVSGANPERSQPVGLSGSNTTWNIVAVNSTTFRFLESVSGRALTAWANVPDQDSNSSPLTLEANRAGDDRQLFFFTTPL
ncbi:hypothetical protein GYMLUDRAFT_86570 [Collybiopsis luxurians FD-317 M1]|uniref:Ricin B lectin domain-containing protein n=1 Tax=Collybiopsis luxurians FD-317 M1 TaxID=944289 RepID=A0A0D0C5A4_9AGAR|nr:hypothetical protein GYMLUDRAFT_86570 [Collybiopsis luxurians FD-317 M1]